MTMDMIYDDYMRGQECRREESCIRGCCMAMKEMDDECMCEWMKMMVQQQRGDMGEEDMRIAEMRYLVKLHSCTYNKVGGQNATKWEGQIHYVIVGPYLKKANNLWIVDPSVLWHAEQAC